MPYGTIKVDNITYTLSGVDSTVTVSGIVNAISGTITVTGAISGASVSAPTGTFTTLTGTTTVGTTATFATGVYTTSLSGATITGNTGQFTSITGGTAGFTTVTGTTVTGTTANFVSGVFTTQISGTTVTGNTGNFSTLNAVSGVFTQLSGTTVTGTTANFTSGVFTTLSGTTINVASGVFASGTVAAPSVAVGTSGNGLYSPNTNQLGVATAGTNRITVDASGNVTVDGGTLYVDAANNRVGVGLTSLNYRFTASESISSTTSTLSAFINEYNNFDANATTSYPLISLERAGKASVTYPSIATFGVARYEDVGSNARTRLDLKLSHGAVGTPDTTVMSFLSSGNVGIGTSSPSYTLDVGSSAIQIGKDTDAFVQYKSSAGNWHVGANASNAYVFYSGTYGSGSERARIDSSGRVGIGTSSPGVKIDIVSDNNTSLASVLRVNSNNVTVNTSLAYDGLIGSGELLVRTSSASKLYLGTNNTNALTIDSSQQVGIGTSSPSCTLDVGSSLIQIGKDTDAFVQYKSSAGNWHVGANASNAYVFYSGNYGSGSNRMMIDSDGNVLIGISSGATGLLNVGPVTNKTGIFGSANTAGNPGIQGAHTSNSATGYVAYFANSGSSTGLYISNTAAWQSTSDERLKTDIQTLDVASRLMQIKPRSYLWKSQAASDKPTKRNFGFIAQEMQDVFPDLVGTSPDGMLSVEYTGLIAPLVNTVQFLKAELDALKAKVAALEGHLEKSCFSTDEPHETHLLVQGGQRDADPDLTNFSMCPEAA